MYAIIKSGSRQYQVRPADVIEVNRLNIDEGGNFETDQVLLARPEGEDAVIGAPFVSGAKVRGKVLGHKRGRKILVFKFKRRKNYKRTRGHRQELTRLLIESIEVGGKKVEVKAPPPKKAKAQPKDAAQQSAAPKEAAKEPTAPKDVAKDKAEAKAAPKDAAKDKAEAKPKAAAKPKATAKDKAEAKPKATAKPKAAAKDEKPKAKASDKATGKSEDK